MRGAIRFSILNENKLNQITSSYYKLMERAGGIWLGWFIVAVVLGLSALVGYRPNLSLWLLMVGAAAAGIFALVALRNLPAALTIVLLTSATSGVTLGTGRATPLPAGLLMIAGVVGIWIIRMMLRERRISLLPSPLNLPVFLFLMAALVSWVVGYAVWDYRLFVEKNLFIVQAGQYALFLFSFASAYLVAHHSLSEKTLQTWLLIVIGIGLAEITLESFMGIYKGRDQGITGSLLIFPITLLGAQLFFNNKLDQRLRTLSGLAFLLWAYWAFQNLSWKGGWAPALVGLLVLVPFYSRKLSFFIGIAGFISVLWKWDWIWNVVILGEAESGGVRPYIWLDIANMVLPRSPVFGLGLVNYMYYWYVPGFLPQSRLFAGWDRWNAWGYAIPSHSMFVDIFAQTGILGLLLFLWAIGAILWVMLRVIWRQPPGFLRAFSLGVFGGFVGMLVGSFWFADWLIPFAYNITITGFRHSAYAWLLVGAVLGIYYRQEAENHNRTA